MRLRFFENDVIKFIWIQLLMFSQMALPLLSFLQENRNDFSTWKNLRIFRTKQHMYFVNNN